MKPKKKRRIMKRDKKKEPGLQYMLSLRINPAKSMSGVEDQLARATDRKTAIDLLIEIGERYTGGGDRKRDFYTLKNSTFELSFALSSAFDGNILRNACNWIYENKEEFGSTILEVGCDIGIMSCYLAETFPNAKIVSIDRCKEAIENAKKLAEKRNITNVEFLATDLESLSQNFDTVFSMRVMHENISADTKEDLVNDLTEQANIYREEVSDYARQLREHIADGGNLISIERIGRNALFLGWIEALNERGIHFSVDNYKEIVCREVDEDSVFQAFSASLLDDSISNVTDQRDGERNAIDLFFSICEKYTDFTAKEYVGWEAKNAYEYLRGDLIEGYVVEDTRDHTRCKLTIWTHRSDKNKVVYYVNNNGNAGTIVFDLGEKERVIQTIRGDVENMKKYSFMKAETMRP